MINVIHQSWQKARKRYWCDGSEYLLNEVEQGLDIVFSFAEMRVIAEIKRFRINHIQIGETYIRQFNTDGGDVWTWRCRKVVWDILVKHNLFNND